MFNLSNTKKIADPELTQKRDELDTLKNLLKSHQGLEKYKTKTEKGAKTQEQIKEIEQQIAELEQEIENLENGALGKGEDIFRTTPQENWLAYIKNDQLKKEIENEIKGKKALVLAEDGVYSQRTYNKNLQPALYLSYTNEKGEEKAFVFIPIFEDGDFKGYEREDSPDFAKLQQLRTGMEKISEGARELGDKATEIVKNAWGGALEKIKSLGGLAQKSAEFLGNFISNFENPEKKLARLEKELGDLEAQNKEERESSKIAEKKKEIEDTKNKIKEKKGAKDGKKSNNFFDKIFSKKEKKDTPEKTEERKEKRVNKFFAWIEEKKEGLKNLYEKMNDKFFGVQIYEGEALKNTRAELAKVEAQIKELEGKNALTDEEKTQLTKLKDRKKDLKIIIDKTVLNVLKNREEKNGKNIEEKEKALWKEFEPKNQEVLKLEKELGDLNTGKTTAETAVKEAKEKLEEQRQNNSVTNEQFRTQEKEINKLETVAKKARKAYNKKEAELNRAKAEREAVFQKYRKEIAQIEEEQGKIIIKRDRIENEDEEIKKKKESEKETEIKKLKEEMVAKEKELAEELKKGETERDETKINKLESEIKDLRMELGELNLPLKAKILEERRKRIAEACVKKSVFELGGNIGDDGKITVESKQALNELYLKTLQRQRVKELGSFISGEKVQLFWDKLDESKKGKVLKGVISSVLLAGGSLAGAFGAGVINNEQLAGRLASRGVGVAIAAITPMLTGSEWGRNVLKMFANTPKEGETEINETKAFAKRALVAGGIAVGSALFTSVWPVAVIAMASFGAKEGLNFIFKKFVNKNIEHRLQEIKDEMSKEGADEIEQEKLLKSMIISGLEADKCLRISTNTKLVKGIINGGVSMGASIISTDQYIKAQDETVEEVLSGKNTSEIKTNRALGILNRRERYLEKELEDNKEEIEKLKEELQGDANNTELKAKIKELETEQQTVEAKIEEVAKQKEQITQNISGERKTETSLGSTSEEETNSDTEAVSGTEIGKTVSVPQEAIIGGDENSWGVTYAFRAQLRANPELAKSVANSLEINEPTEEELNDNEFMAKFTKAIALQTGYIDEDGKEIRINRDAIGKVAYVLKLNEGGQPQVLEITDFTTDANGAITGKVEEVNIWGAKFETFKEAYEYERVVKGSGEGVASDARKIISGSAYERSLETEGGQTTPTPSEETFTSIFDSEPTVNDPLTQEELKYFIQDYAIKKDEILEQQIKDIGEYNSKIIYLRRVLKTIQDESWKKDKSFAAENYFAESEREHSEKVISEIEKSLTGKQAEIEVLIKHIKNAEIYGQMVSDSETLTIEEVINKINDANVAIETETNPARIAENITGEELLVLKKLGILDANYLPNTTGEHNQSLLNDVYDRLQTAKAKNPEGFKEIKTKNLKEVNAWIEEQSKPKPVISGVEERTDEKSTTPAAQKTTETPSRARVISPEATAEIRQEEVVTGIVLQKSYIDGLKSVTRPFNSGSVSLKCYTPNGLDLRDLKFSGPKTFGDLGKNPGIGVDTKWGEITSIKRNVNYHDAIVGNSDKPVLTINVGSRVGTGEVKGFLVDIPKNTDGITRVNIERDGRTFSYYFFDKCSNRLVPVEIEGEEPEPVAPAPTEVTETIVPHEYAKHIPEVAIGLPKKEASLVSLEPWIAKRISKYYSSQNRLAEGTKLVQIKELVRFEKDGKTYDEYVYSYYPAQISSIGKNNLYTPDLTKPPIFSHPINQTSIINIKPGDGVFTRDAWGRNRLYIDFAYSKIAPTRVNEGDIVYGGTVEDFDKYQNIKAEIKEYNTLVKAIKEQDSLIDKAEKSPHLALKQNMGKEGFQKYMEDLWKAKYSIHKDASLQLAKVNMLMLENEKNNLLANDVPETDPTIQKIDLKIATEKLNQDLVISKYETYLKFITNNRDKNIPTASEIKTAQRSIETLKSELEKSSPNIAKLNSLYQEAKTKIENLG